MSFKGKYSLNVLNAIMSLRLIIYLIKNEQHDLYT